MLNDQTHKLQNTITQHLKKLRKNTQTHYTPFNCSMYYILKREETKKYFKTISNYSLQLDQTTEEIRYFITN